LVNIQALYDELYMLRFPGGISSEDIAIHAEITFDAAYNVKRLLGYYFNEEQLNFDDLRISEASVQHLDHLIRVLNDLQDYKRRHDELAQALIDALHNQSRE